MVMKEMKSFIRQNSKFGEELSFDLVIKEYKKNYEFALKRRHGQERGTNILVF